MIRGILELLRPANVVTALADVLAGFAVGGMANVPALPWLLVSTACLYAGGVVLNDVFDREIDSVERPERPIPSGRVPVHLAAATGVMLLGGGIASAVQATRTAAVVATAIAALVLVYDSWGRRQRLLAPINMGLCRALNLLLGLAAVPERLEIAWPVAIIPLLYISGITALSRGEVHGGTRRIATISLALVSAALFAVLSLALRSGERALMSSILALAAMGRVLPPFWAAHRTLRPEEIGRAVARGVLSLILVDATIGAAYAGPTYGALILSTGLVAGWLARAFAVT